MQCCHRSNRVLFLPVLSCLCDLAAGWSSANSQQVPHTSSFKAHRYLLVYNRNVKMSGLIEIPRIHGAVSLTSSHASPGINFMLAKGLPNSCAALNSESSCTETWCKEKWPEIPDQSWHESIFSILTGPSHQQHPARFLTDTPLMIAYDLFYHLLLDRHSIQLKSSPSHIWCDLYKRHRFWRYQEYIGTHYWMGMSLSVVPYPLDEKSWNDIDPYESQWTLADGWMA